MGDTEHAIIDIIIPVYRGMDATRRCIESVLAAENRVAFRLVIINDASPEPDLTHWLGKIDDSRVLLISNERNVGFVASVNRAAAQNPERNFIILNADTLVTGDWVDRLVACSRANPDAATITPFSNNGSIASYPVIDANNPLPSGYSLAEIDALFAQINAGESIDIPVGVGFCMFVNRAAWEAKGGFDPIFGRGYGEEVDFCMASRKDGWRNLLATDVFVFHQGSVSFGINEAPSLQRNAQRIIDERYPEFSELVAKFYSEDPLASSRVAVLTAQISANPEPRLLMISHSWGGGVQKHVHDLTVSLTDAGRANVFVLQPSPGASGGEASLMWASQGDFIIAKGSLVDGPSCWEKLLAALQLSRLHFHHIAHWPGWVLELPDRLGLPYDVTVHDFWPVCPQFHFLDKFGDYCGRPDTEGCKACLASRPDPWGWGIERWREFMGQYLNSAERVISPSASAAQVIGEYLPQFDCEVWPHIETDLAPFFDLPVSSIRQRKVAILGTLSDAKGLRIVEQVISAAFKQNADLQFVIIGATTRTLEVPADAPVSISGTYEPKDLYAICLRERIDAFWFASVVPETYGYALSVAIATGLPTVAFAIGAQLDRLNENPHAQLLPPNAPVAEIVSTLLELPEIYSVAAQTDRAECGTAAEDYLAQYCEVLAGERAAPLSAATLNHSLAALPRAKVESTADPLPIQELIELALDCRQSNALSHLRQRAVSGEQHLHKLLEQQVRDEAEVAHHKTTIQGLKRAHSEHVESLLGRIREQLSVLDAKDRELKDVGSYAEQLRQHNQELTTQVSELDGKLRAIESSTFWRLTYIPRVATHQLKKSVPALARRLSTLRRLAIFVRYHYTIGGMTGLMASIRRRSGQTVATWWGRLNGVLLKKRNHDGRVSAAVGPVCLGTTDQPVLSIVIPSYGEHGVTLQCLASIAANPPSCAYEVLVADDAYVEPFDPRAMEVEGVRVMRQPQNLGFLRNVNRAVSETRGEFIMLLNNDTLVTAGAFDVLLTTISEDSRVGAAGAKLLDQNGRLQEAGGIVWRDGSAWNWGKGEDPEDPRFNYVREADYCSAAALMMPRSVWNQIGGFDERFIPAYYEDTDLCFAVKNLGLKVVFQPMAQVVHLEGVSHGTSTRSGIKKHQLSNQALFREKWAVRLGWHEDNGQRPELERDRNAHYRILWVEACMLTPDQDSGSLRTWRIMQILVSMGQKVTFVADNLQRLEPYTERLQQMGVEVLYAPQVRSVAAYIERQGAQYDVIVLCRHYIAIKYVELIRHWCPGAKLWFDTIDLHYLRLYRQHALEPNDATKALAELAYREEMQVIANTDITLVVSDTEVQELVDEAPSARVEVLSNIHVARNTVAPRANREGIMFVGGFQHPPNIDAIEYYAKEIWPLIRKAHPAVKTYVIGSKMPENLKQMGVSAGLDMVGFVEDLTPYYERCAVSIAPLRYGAGVKGKVNQALSYGLPVVGSAMAFEGMAVVHGEHVIVAETPEAFASSINELLDDTMLWQRLSDNGRAVLGQQFSFDVAEQTLTRLLRSSETTE